MSFTHIKSLFINTFKPIARLQKSIAAIAVVLAVALSLGACSSNPSRKGGESSSLDQSLSARFASMVNNRGEWTQLQVPVKIKLNSPEKFSISGRAYMIRGKRIYISLRILGMEVATADIEGDSVWVADKFNKRYIAEDIKSIMGGGDISISDLQDLLLGRIFITGEKKITEKSAKKLFLAEEATTWTITPKKKIYGVGYTFTFDKSDNHLSQLAVATSGNVVKAMYSNPYNCEQGEFMQQIDVSGKVGKQSLSGRFTTTMKSAKWSNLKMPKRQDFDGYNRLNGEMILKSIGKK